MRATSGGLLSEMHLACTGPMGSQALRVYPIKSRAAGEMEKWRDADWGHNGSRRFLKLFFHDGDLGATPRGPTRCGNSCCREVFAGKDILDELSRLAVN